MRRTSQIENYPRTTLKDSFDGVPNLKAIEEGGEFLVLISADRIHKPDFARGGALSLF